MVGLASRLGSWLLTSALGAGVGPGLGDACSAISVMHALHGFLVPRKISSVPSATISLQNGQMAITASHSSAHLQRLATFTAHPQHRG